MFPRLQRYIVNVTSCGEVTSAQLTWCVGADWLMKKNN